MTRCTARLSRDAGTPAERPARRAFGRRVRLTPPSLIVAFLLVAGACTSRVAYVPEPVPLDPPALQAAWAATLSEVKDELERGRYHSADSALNRFVEMHRGTPQSAEAYFWLAVVNLDPGNRGGSPRAALVAADAYLAGGTSLPNFELAQVLRRTAGVLESVQPPEAIPEPSPVPVIDSAERARSAEEIARLKAELEKAQAELERIKKRIRP